jgi:hypothetical protein
VRRRRTSRVSEGEDARRTHDSRRYRGETDLVCDQNTLRTEFALGHREWSPCGVGEMINAYGQKQGPSKALETMARILSNISIVRLDGLILMGQVGSRRLDCVPCLSKQDKDILAATSSSPRSTRAYLEATVDPVPLVASHLVSHLMGGTLERRAAP